MPAHIHTIVTLYHKCAIWRCWEICGVFHGSSLKYFGNYQRLPLRVLFVARKVFADEGGRYSRGGSQSLIRAGH